MQNPEFVKSADVKILFGKPDDGIICFDAGNFRPKVKFLVQYGWNASCAQTKNKYSIRIFFFDLDIPEGLLKNPVQGIE